MNDSAESPRKWSRTIYGLKIIEKLVMNLQSNLKYMV